MKKCAVWVLGVVVLLCAVEWTMRLAGELYLKKLYVQPFAGANMASENFNIICLGESSTAGLWVKQEESYPAQLQEMLRGAYPEKKVNVFVPHHVGQNTSQIVNRIEQHIAFYKPRLIIIMAGYNNEWSLAESNVVRFLPWGSVEDLKLRAAVFLEQFRIFKMLKYLYFKYIFDRRASYYDFKMLNLKGQQYMWGGPELFVGSPEETKRIESFALPRTEAFVKAWHYDIERIVAAATRHHVRILLMTYHINPTYLPTNHFIDVSEAFQLPLVRNDLVFKSFIMNKTIDNYLLPNKDRWHPNKEGYRIIAENALKAIREENLLD